MPSWRCRPYHPCSPSSAPTFDRLLALVGACERADGRVDVTVTDDGPGVPEMERAVVSGETTIDQLNHGQGIGLWFVKWVADRSDGSLVFEDCAEGAAVTIRL